MDEELTDGFSDQCAQCGAVCWSVSDGGQFFCKNCHNVIERTNELVGNTDLQTNRISSVLSVKRKHDDRGGIQWLACEGFQFILKHQAEALVALGVSPQFKTDVLWNFWTRYLQKTEQAFTYVSVNSARYSTDHTSESETESTMSCSNEAASEMGTASLSGYSSDEGSSVWSGCLDAQNYLVNKARKSWNFMTMPHTLALCHLALLWIREAITLADLLRLVSKRHIPYFNAHELLPEEMKFYGRDALIFKVESVPSYQNVHTLAVQLAKTMELPIFPAVSHDCLLHPALLSLRYLLEINLPNKLHSLICQVIEKSAMGSDEFLTFNPAVRKPKLLCYELQAAALIIVTMKLLFKLDDHVEWKFFKKALKKVKKNSKKKTTKGSKIFSLKRWFIVVQPALEQHKKKEEEAQARRLWKSKKVIIQDLAYKARVNKRRRMVDHLQGYFHTLAGTEPQPTILSSPSFVFNWGNEDGADGPSLHHKNLGCVLKKKKKMWRLMNHKYWHTALRLCLGRCRDHFWEQEPSLPRMYVWVLGLFSFLLGVDEGQLHREVIEVERHLFAVKAVQLAKRATSQTSSERMEKNVTG